MARILLVDDEDLVISLVSRSLRAPGHDVLSATNGLEALACARRHRPDLVILDIIMPGMDGIELCARLRQDPALVEVPVLFLTARRAVQDRVEGLDAGGDDSLPKPFEINELEARVRALLRRVRLAGEARCSADRPEALTLGELSFDPRTGHVRVGDRTAELTPTECELLHHLMIHADEVFSAQELLEQVWGYHRGTGDTSLVRWHVRNLRAKIEDDPAHPRYLRTAPRHGYTLSSGL